MGDFVEGLRSISARRLLGVVGALILAVAGIQLLSVRAVLEDSILEVLANGMGLISLGLAALTLAYGLSGRERTAPDFLPCPECKERIHRTAERCPRCTAQIGACEECGQLIPKDEMTCRHCGAEYEPVP